MKRMQTVAQRRRYGVLNVAQAKRIATNWLRNMALDRATSFGLPEIDDRHHVWRVPILQRDSAHHIGECVIDARSSLILPERSTEQEVLEARLLGRTGPDSRKQARARTSVSMRVASALRNTVAAGDAEQVLLDLPAGSVQLAFTSPPYYNARPEYTDYITYDEYLLKLRKVIHSVHHVLEEGRFFVINTSPVLIRRKARSSASRRLAVPFDLHRIIVEEGFDFIDDIIWLKPEGAGWATGRGRRFAADRNPLQYKAVPVTEYVLVYRKRTDKLIDWHIRNHPDPKAVRESKIPDGYERTNIWKIKPAHSKLHPAVFPLDLAERVISYYSFRGDVVLDPFAGIGTVGAAAVRLERRFVLIEQNDAYVEVIRRNLPRWRGSTAGEVLWLHCQRISACIRSMDALAHEGPRLEPGRTAGSAIPASAKPRARSRQLSQRPHGIPEMGGS
jgi:DNA modification methylase